MTERIPRSKMKLADGRTVYVYGSTMQPRVGLSEQDIATADVVNAGYYDLDRNEVVMTEPTSIEEGVYHRDRR